MGNHEEADLTGMGLVLVSNKREETNCPRWDLRRKGLGWQGEEIGLDLLNN